MTELILRSPGRLGPIGKTSLTFHGQKMGTVFPCYVTEAKITLGIGLRTGLTIIVNPIVIFKANPKV